MLKYIDFCPVLLTYYAVQVFCGRFYPINMKFGHDIPRVVRRCAMTFLSHPSCSSGFIHDFLDHYILEWQKAVFAYL